MGAVLDLGKGQVTFNKLGVTMNLGESSTGHYVIDLISDCETLTIAPGSVIKHSEESVQDPGINIENSEFSNLLCGSERVTVIDVNKPRISLVGADCEQSCRRWTIGNLADDSGVFVIKDECCKNQQTILLGPWTGRTIIEERCDEFEGFVSCLTREEEVLIQKSCRQTWRGAESVLVQSRICATKTGPTSQKQRMFQEENGFDFRDAATRRLISAELRRFYPDSVPVHPPDVVCRSGFSLKNQQKVRGKCKPLVNSCVQYDSRTIKKRETGFLGRALACVNSGSRQCAENSSNGKAGSDKKSSNFREVAGPGRQCDQKTWHCVGSPLVVEQNVKLKSGLDLKKLPKTVSLEQVKTLVRELEQEDVCDMEIDLAEVRWQESDIELLNVFAQDLETAVECLPVEEDEDEDVSMRGDEHHDGSDVEEQVPMDEGGEHVEAAPEGEVYSGHDVERINREHCGSFTPIWDIRACTAGRRNLQFRRHEEWIVTFVQKTCSPNFRDRQFRDKCWISMDVSAWTFWVCLIGAMQRDR